jgi:uncharacterized heparinase superfamily protein
VSLIAPETFRFLAVERTCAAAAGWRAPGAERLWIYNLHYFDDLNAHGAAQRHHWHEGLLRRWVAENPPAAGPGWEPYPLSRRIVNWVKWALGGNCLPPACDGSLAVQARWLMRRLEFHILGNHLLANGKALIHAGLYFEGVEADRWYARGSDIVARQLREQVLDDGGHFERSTMYHAIVLEDLLDLVNLLAAYGRDPPAEWLGAVARMRKWLGMMRHPDGEIAFFNDAAFGIASRPAELEAYASRLALPAVNTDPQLPLVVLGASGYVRAAVGPASLICDCAPLGPEYLPAHAHADTLSFELSLAGQRVLVNSGTSLYGTSAERQRQRGTAAHNTVAIDGRDSSEVWSGFRVARRAHARLHAATVSTTGVSIDASHDGYRRLSGRNEHRRRWVLDTSSLSVEDRISGEFDKAEAFFHLHPDVQVLTASGHELTLAVSPQRTIRVSFAGAADLEVRPGSWHPRFGVTVPNQQIVARFGQADLMTTLRWFELP